MVYLSYNKLMKLQYKCFLLFAFCLGIGFFSAGCRLVTGKAVLWEEMPVEPATSRSRSHRHPIDMEDGKTFLPSGNYRAHLDWISEGVMVLVLQREGYNYPLRLYVPTPRNWRDHQGGFQFFSSQLGQPFDMKGNVRLSEESLRRFRYVPCSYYKKTFGCQYDPVRCQKRTYASGGMVRGQRTDEHLFKRETLELEVEFFLPGRALPVAEFKGEGKRVRPVKVLRGLCH